MSNGKIMKIRIRMNEALRLLDIGIGMKNFIILKKARRKLRDSLDLVRSIND